MTAFAESKVEFDSLFSADMLQIGSWLARLSGMMVIGFIGWFASILVENQLFKQP